MNRTHTACTTILLAVSLALGATACETGDLDPPATAPAGNQMGVDLPQAHADLIGRREGLRGTVSMKQVGENVILDVRIKGLTPGEHGFHVHERGDCSADDFSSAGDHFAPHGNRHGGPHMAVHHAGDLGNVRADAQGTVREVIQTRSITLGPGITSVIGRAIVVHEKPDDFVTQPSGAAGERLLCGIIEPRRVSAVDR